jgi:hypothetical protein
VQVDLPPDETALPVSEVLAAVRASRGSSQLALREGEFWQARAVPRPPQHVPPQPVVQPDASYLVTGGLRGIGLASARWLVDQGARHLVLLGRSVPATAHAEIAAMEAAGAALPSCRPTWPTPRRCRLAWRAPSRAGRRCAACCTAPA